jgi:hypothetical protein
VKLIRGGAGLGDALYLQAVVRHLTAKGQRLTVSTSWPDVFRPLGVPTVPFTRAGIDILAHYSKRKNHRTKQFEDVCIQAGIEDPVELAIDWPTPDSDLVNRLRADGRPIVCVQLPRSPMGRTDGFGAELLPDCRVIQQAINALTGHALIVQIGAGSALFRFRGIDIDLANETTVSELLDVASIASGFLGYVSFVVPLAESFRKPALLVWSRRGLKSPQGYIRQITPQKILHRETSMHVIDDWRPDELLATEERFRNAVCRPR